MQEIITIKRVEIKSKYITLINNFLDRKVEIKLT